MNIDNIEVSFKYKDYSNIDWSDSFFYSENKKLFTVEFIETFKDKIDWDWLFVNKKNFSEKFLRKYVKYYSHNCWVEISRMKNISEKFIRDFENYLDFESLIQQNKIYDDLIKKHIDKIDFNIICSSPLSLSEDFIEKYLKYLNINLICMFQRVSENFIEKHKDIVNWSYISYWQKLSEKFIEKHKDKVDWDYIFQKQQLSEEFINNHSNYLKKT